MRGTGGRPFGLGAGLATIGNIVRYPDALVTCAKVSGDARVIPGAAVVFEVISPSTSRTDRVVKLREYLAVPSIHRYVLIEQDSIGLAVLTRTAADRAWAATVLLEGETLQMPEIGIEIPITELYEGVDLPEAGAQPLG